MATKKRAGKVRRPAKKVKRPKLAKSVKGKCTGHCRIRTEGMGVGEVRSRVAGSRRFEIVRVK